MVADDWGSDWAEPVASFEDFVGPAASFEDFVELVESFEDSAEPPASFGYYGVLVASFEGFVAAAAALSVDFVVAFDSFDPSVPVGSSSVVSFAFDGSAFVSSVADPYFGFAASAGLTDFD